MKTYVAYAVAVTLGLGVSLATAQVAGQQTTDTNGAEQSVPDQKTKEQKQETLSTVVVSAASLIQRADLAVPTPQVPVSTRTLGLQTQTNIGEAMNVLPYLGNSAVLATNSEGGGSQIGSTGADLRGLGSQHTLVLLDGQRFVGDGDLNSIPSILIQNVQVVTGGASATWGSGAVSGVVNVQLKHDLQGLQVDASMGMSQAGDALQPHLGLAYGTSFADGRGHVTIGFNYVKQTMVGNSGSMSVRDGEGVSAPVELPNGAIEILPGVGYNDAAVGGVITSGVLNGLGFTPGGALTPVNLGTVVAPGTTIGGLAPEAVTVDPLMGPLNHYSFLGRTDYSLNDNLQVFAQLQEDQGWGDYPWFSPPVTGITISANNAFLQPSIRNTLAANGESSFQMGYDYNESISDRPIVYRRKDTQGTLGLKGALGSDWDWSTYVSYGQHVDHSTILGWPLEQNWLNAVDAVTSPVTGAPVCAIALTDPSTNCAPLDLFGRGAASQAAKDYILTAIQDDDTDTLGEWSFKMQGEPVRLPAGAVSVAFGADYQYWSETLYDSPNVSSCEVMTLCFSGLGGSYNVKEGFTEVFVPLVKSFGPLHNFNFDGGARYSDYSSSGPVWSWKAGLINDIGGGIKARVDFSRDIRAPNVSELYSSLDHGFNTITDPVTHTNVLDVPTNVGGNRGLRPEKANTLTVGLIWAPKALPSVSTSVDFYDIKVADIITALSAQTIVDQCAGGNQALCSDVFRDNAGNLTLIDANNMNVGTLSESGVDTDFSYRKSVSFLGQDGGIEARMLATWVQDVKTSQAGVTTEYLDSLSQEFGVPRWKGVLSLGFYSPLFSLDGRARYLSAAEYNANEVIINNRIPQYFYFDLGTSYNFGASHQMGLYFNIDNVGNKLAPPGMWQSGVSNYDYMGRYYTLGFRLRMN